MLSSVASGIAVAVGGVAVGVGWGGKRCVKERMKDLEFFRTGVVF